MEISKIAMEQMKAHFTKSTEQGGIMTGQPGMVQAFFHLENLEQDKYNFYDFDRRVFKSTCAKARRQGMKVLGIIHTHPGGPDEPSQDDLDCAGRRYTNAVWSSGTITFYKRSGIITGAV